ncbi:hypothetical protein EYD10_01275 [Varanus komodoensis]|nr:hypothetical protein EYD10_01275 [Varanus komodoensis]
MRSPERSAWRRRYFFFGARPEETGADRRIALCCCINSRLRVQSLSFPAPPNTETAWQRDTEGLPHNLGLIFRFKFLMLITLACAALTVIFFIVSQVTEGHWKWGNFTVQVNSAFFTGIYGMWNLYVFALMFLYAPSHKNYGEDQSTVFPPFREGEKL